MKSQRKKRRSILILKYKFRRQRAKLRKITHAVHGAWERNFGETNCALIIAISILTGLIGGISMRELGLPEPVMIVVAAVVFILLSVLGWLITTGLVKLVRKLTHRVKSSELALLLIAFFGAAAFFLLSVPSIPTIYAVLIGIMIALTEVWFTKSLYALIRYKRHTIGVIVVLSITFCVNVLIGCFLVCGGFQEEQHTSYRQLARTDREKFDAAAESIYAAEWEQIESFGPFTVSTFAYGTGSEAKKVDLTPYVWNSDWGDKLRKLYWGDGLESVPVAGQVWMPEGPGCFPTMFIIHGNHIMTEQSHLGYDYIGEYLASYGYIVVSVDENRLNGYIDGGLYNENDARSVLLLENIAYLISETAREGSPVFGKMDTGSIAVCGHSRGGEAAATAALFNNYDVYPENGMIRFRYHFNIKAVAAISPCCNQYMPAGHTPAPVDVNYLVIHGSNDGDVDVMMGMDQYQAVSFSGTGEYFKSSVYVFGANHGQFNRRWGKHDVMEPMSFFLNTANLISAKDQENILKYTLKQFLDSSLSDDEMARRFFSECVANNAGFFPTMITQSYQDNGFVSVAEFEDESDLTIETTENGDLIECEATSVVWWLEENVTEPDEDGGVHTFANHAVNLKWDKPYASYSLSGAEGDLAGGMQVEGGSLQFDVMNLSLDIEEITPLDFIVEIADSRGNRARRSVGEYLTLYPPVPVRLYKLDFLIDRQCNKQQFCTVSIPLEDFLYSEDQTGSAPDLNNITRIRFLFQKTEKGNVLIDHIGFDITP